MVLLTGVSIAGMTALSTKSINLSLRHLKGSVSKKGGQLFPEWGQDSQESKFAGLWFSRWLLNHFYQSKLHNQAIRV
jgi:hypothetical protein